MFFHGNRFHNAGYGWSTWTDASGNSTDAGNCAGIKKGCLWCRKTVNEISWDGNCCKRYRHNGKSWECDHGTCCNLRFHQRGHAHSGNRTRIWFWNWCGYFWQNAPRCTLSAKHPPGRRLAGTVFLLCRRCAESHGRNQEHAPPWCDDSYRKNTRWEFRRVKKERFLRALWCDLKREIRTDRKRDQTYRYYRWFWPCDRYRGKHRNPARQPCTGGSSH